MDIKPNVFPSKDQQGANKDTATKIAEYEAKKAEVVDGIFNEQPSDTPQQHTDAMEAMRARTMNQINQNKQNGIVIDESLAEKKPRTNAVASNNNAEQIRLRDEQLEKNKEQTRNYQNLSEAATNRHLQPKEKQHMENNNNFTPSTPTQPPTNTSNGYGDNYGSNNPNLNPQIVQLSQPNYNCAFDVIPLPSEGKLYANKRKNVRIGFMTTADENILTSPNLLQSGQFLEVLINRKLLETDMRYSDLHIGDRNAIMLWLRATSYGEMYPITILDEQGEAFDADVNLNDLKTKKLGAEPDVEGLFEFTMPLSGAVIKFKLLTCGDVDAVEQLVSRDTDNDSLVDNTAIYSLKRAVVEVNGTRDRQSISDFVDSIRIHDGNEFNKYIEKIESGIDLTINVPTPRGGSIATFLPLNIRFFWPNIQL